MGKLPSIQLVKRQEIDTAAWDKAIINSPNGRVYASSWFLDEMAPGWQALIAGDYEMVMPLPVRKKMGISYVFQPAFCQQLGVFAGQQLSNEITDAFLHHARKHFLYLEYNGNAAQAQSGFFFQLRKNYLLSLQPSFTELKHQFSRSAKRNIAKAITNGISIKTANEAKTLIELHRGRYQYKLASSEDLQAIERVFAAAFIQKKAHVFLADDADGNSVASSGYLEFRDRLVFIINGNMKSALDSGATHLLKQYAIEQFSGSNRWMDFEGSDSPRFARFYEQYGAEAVDNYPYFIFNQLPVPLRWMKPAGA